MENNKKKKSTSRQNQIVKLRKKTLTNGDTSLYLDIYYKGKRSFEFMPEFRLKVAKDTNQRLLNKELLIKAEARRAQKQLEYINNEYGLTPDYKKNISLVDYFTEQMQKRKDNESNYQNWQSTLKHIKNFEKGKIALSQINDTWLQSWHEFLKKQTKTKAGKPLSINSIFSYYNKVIACLKHAFKEKIISFNPSQSSIGVRAEDSKREFLTEEEVQKMIDTDCDDAQLKRAFIFSCITGLRWSDVTKLIWSEVQDGMIVFTQKKTGGLEYLPITEQALQLLGERQGDEEKIFHLNYSAWNNLKLREWAMRAGVKKKVTFHVARHTMATLSITSGTDLFTVSKLLGHKHIKTTQIYSRVIDEKKREAVEKLPKFKL